MGKHIDELIRLGRLGSGRTPIDVSAALDYHRANREEILQELKELKELALANPESHRLGEAHERSRS